LIEKNLGLKGMAMTANPVIDVLGRRLRLAVIGGAPGSFIGGVHRMAARMDDRYELVCGVCSSNQEKTVRVGTEMGFAPDRNYATVDELFDTESRRGDGVDVVAIMTPNDSHFPYAMAALAKGFHVICDKPMTNTLDDAKALHAAVLASGKVFCLTHNYNGYPLVRQARAMIAAGMLGELRMVQVEYVQGGRAVRREMAPGSPRAWKYDKAISGPSLVMGDIGSHAHNLLRFITGLEVKAVCAQVGSVVPGQQVDDYAGAMLRLDNGAPAMFLATQAAAGIENNLKIRVCGSLGTLEWRQEIPQRLGYFPLDAPAQVFTPNGPGTLPLSARSCRIVKGHPEGFPGSFANLYSDVAEAVVAAISGTPADPLALHFPTSLDGLRGIEFMYAAIASSKAGGAWVELA
jgi:predicted dehydrogenase